MTLTRNRSFVAAIVAAACTAVPAAASAYSLPPTYKSDAAQSGTDAGLDPTPSPSTAKSTFPPVDFPGGDTPADHAGASRAATATPTMIEVDRPERTLRDVDQALPIALAGSGLVLVLAVIGMTLMRTRLVTRPGRSH